jgi:hypothetical protein
MPFAVRSLLAVLLAGSALSLLSACHPVHRVTIGRDGSPHPEVHDHHHRGGPPPHAPAHGYRRKHEHAYRSGGEVELVFDSGLGVYMVVGMPDIYFWEGVYLRMEGGVWSSCAQIDGAWKPYPVSSVPPGLRAKHKHGGKPGHAGKHGHGRGKGPAKHW